MLFIPGVQRQSVGACGGGGGGECWTCCGQHGSCWTKSKFYPV